MRVIVNGVVHNPEDAGIILYLNRGEREQIANMSPDCLGLYGQFSEYTLEEDREDAMQIARKLLQLDNNSPVNVTR